MNEARPFPGRCIVVSPHLDDAILSCYPLIRSYQEQGCLVELWTVMAGMPHANTPFSGLAMKISGYDPFAYVRIRQKEDLKVAESLGIRAVHFYFVDALYRADSEERSLYPDIQTLFYQVDLRELHLVNRISYSLEQELRPGDFLVVPSAICGHVDHILTRVACEMLANQKTFFDEFPYTIRSGKALRKDIQRQWGDLIRIYESQVNLLFPGNSLQYLLSIHQPQSLALPQIEPRIPRIIHFIWVGDAPLPPSARKNLDGWIALLSPKWQIRLWTNSDLTEQAFDSIVLNKIREAPHGIQKADILRYHIMSRMGGWYLDLDFEPIQTIEPIALLLHREDLILCHEEDCIVNKISNGFFACTAGHPSIARMAEAVLIQPLNTGVFDMDHIVIHTGPILFKTILENVKCVVLPRQLFYPVAFSEMLSGSTINLEASFARHVWHSRYRNRHRGRHQSQVSHHKLSNSSQ
jgi:mannosyltransferase OCH1-like enzyme